MFSLDELASYLPDTTQDPGRAELLRGLTLGLVYETIPQAVADTSTLVKTIALEVAARAYRNTSGFAMERVDDYSYTRASGTGAAGVYLTDDERKQLRDVAAGQQPSGARSVRLTSVWQEWP